MAERKQGLQAQTCEELEHFQEKSTPSSVPLNPGILDCTIKICIQDQRLSQTLERAGGLGGLATQPPEAASESATAVEENEDHGGSRQGDQGQSSEVGNQMKVDAHGGRQGVRVTGADVNRPPEAP